MNIQACHIAQFKTDADTPSLLLRPQSSGYILDMIQFIMYQPSAGLSLLSPSYADLDLAQTILVRWGELVPWSWSIWDDQHVAGSECITYLVSAASMISTSLIIRKADYNMALLYTLTFLPNTYVLRSYKRAGKFGCE